MKKIILIIFSLIAVNVYADHKENPTQVIHTPHHEHITVQKAKFLHEEINGKMFTCYQEKWLDCRSKGKDRGWFPYDNCDSNELLDIEILKFYNKSEFESRYYSASDSGIFEGSWTRTNLSTIMIIDDFQKFPKRPNSVNPLKFQSKEIIDDRKVNLYHYFYQSTIRYTNTRFSCTITDI